MSRSISLSLVALGLAACGEGPNAETLVDDLQVMAIQATPPEVGPGDAVQFDIVVGDPLGTDAEVLFWHCTSLGDGCLEQGTPHVWTPPLVEQRASIETTVPAALAALATDEPVRATLLWALACEPGVCPQIGAPESWDLADPTSWLANLPMQGVSLAYSTLALSTRADPLQNPTVIRGSEEDIRAAGGDSVQLSFEVTLGVPPTADSLAFGFATGGGFDATEYAIGDDGAVELTWYAPDEPSTVELYVIVNDGEGGVGVWLGTATVD